MKFAIITVAWFCVCSLVTGSFYWLIVRPWLVNKCINKLSKIRSEYFDARLNKIDGVDHALSLEILNNSERPEFLDHFSFSHIAFGFLIDWKPNRYQMEALEATRSSAPSWLQELHRQKNEALIAAVVINSPFWWPAIFFIWLGSLVFGKLRQFRDNFTVPMSRIPCPC